MIDKNFKDMEEETTDGEETPAEAEEKEGHVFPAGGRLCNSGG